MLSKMITSRAHSHANQHVRSITYCRYLKESYKAFIEYKATAVTLHEGHIASEVNVSYSSA